MFYASKKENGSLIVLQIKSVKLIFQLPESIYLQSTLLLFKQHF